MKFIILLFLFSANLFATKQNDTPIIIKLAVTNSILSSYNKILEGKSWSELKTYTHPSMNRGVVEILLLHKAFEVSGLNIKFDFVIVPNHTRSIKYSKQINILMPTETVWLSSVEEEDFYISTPIISDGEYEKGVYVLKEKLSLYKIENLSDLKKLTAISSLDWTVDWRTLQLMDVNKQSTSHFESMMYMLKHGRADFLLLEFTSNDDLSREEYGVAIAPVSNIKIGLKGSRHFIVNKKHKESEFIYNALERGLKVLRDKGEIAKALRESGFQNKKTTNWIKIN
ncbi:hypothetical protein [Bacteriovorax sp. Seq25_V]|uniref:hypothetical protein n=1 Tax=Bacteriovorax sp. Seq25_V TaxID=1201288 RepID=UPI000389EB27|nr:hypothetical protein [Bacteriovorax sp. Seq25_V]EQC45980.1 hypothetical protein M900_1753 [Bacteriovorax sp. Seq25_V]